jgi:hypothetical protein
MSKKKPHLMTFTVEGRLESEFEIEVEAESEGAAAEVAQNKMENALGAVSFPAGFSADVDSCEVETKDICVLCGKPFGKLKKSDQRVVDFEQTHLGGFEALSRLKVRFPDGEFVCPTHRKIPKKVKDIMYV